MNRPQQRRANQGRRPPAKRPVAVDIWRIPGPMPEIEPITVSPEAGALVRSLGDPPMFDGAAVSRVFVSVIERAAVIAAALALSADLLAEQAVD